MDALLEVQSVSPSTVALRGDRMTIGKTGTDVALDDRTVSRLHASLERLTGGWVLEDLGSRNGTFLNGERLWRPRALRDGDEIRVGASRLVFRCSDGPADTGATSPLADAPTLTPRERDLLVALCRPLLQGSVLSEPASVREVAATLVVSDSAVKKLLGRCFDKFGLVDRDRRRSRLAMEALSRGVVSLADLGGRDDR